MTVGVGGVIFICGAAIGFGSGYYFCKVSLESKYEDLVQEELASIRKVCGRKQDDTVSKSGGPRVNSKVGVGSNEQIKKYDSEGNFRNNKSSLDRVVINDCEKAKRNYASPPIPLQKSRMELQLDEPDTDEGNEEVEEVSEAGIYEITFEDYLNYEEYDKIGLVYHKYDRILCDEQEELVEDIGHTISDEIEKDLHHRNGTLYVRNDLIAADYEIVILNSSYLEHHTDEPGIRKRPKDEDDD